MITIQDLYDISYALQSTNPLTVLVNTTVDKPFNYTLPSVTKLIVIVKYDEWRY